METIDGNRPPSKDGLHVVEGAFLYLQGKVIFVSIELNYIMVHLKTGPLFSILHI